MKEKDINIKSYEGEDAFYSGNDDDYEEFLKSVDGKIKFEDAAPVENTQRLNLAETINLQGVLGKFKKKAGDIAKASKKLTNDIAEQIASRTSADEEGEMGEAEEEPKKAVNSEDNFIAPKSEKPAPVSKPVKEAYAEEMISIDVDEIKSEIKDTVRASISELNDFGGEFSAVSGRFDNVDKVMENLSQELSSANKRLQSIITSGDEAVKDNARDAMQIKSSITDSMNKLSEIQSSIGGVSKLTDSVFDLKNTQMNTKKSIDDLELSFRRLKRKCILGITIISILAAISIALQVILLLS